MSSVSFHTRNARKLAASSSSPPSSSVVNVQSDASADNVAPATDEITKFNPDLLNFVGRSLAGIFQLNVTRAGLVDVLEFGRRAFRWTNSQWKSRKKSLIVRAKFHLENIIDSKKCHLQPVGILYFVVEQAARTDLFLLCGTKTMTIVDRWNPGGSTGSLGAGEAPHDASSNVGIVSSRAREICLIIDASVIYALYEGNGWIPSIILGSNFRIEHIGSRFRALIKQLPFAEFSRQQAVVQLQEFRGYDICDDLVSRARMSLMEACGNMYDIRYLNDLCAISILCADNLCRGDFGVELQYLFTFSYLIR